MIVDAKDIFLRLPLPAVQLPLCPVQQQYIGRGTDLTDFDQKGAGGIAALVQQGLRLVGHVGQQRGVAVVAGDAEGVAGGIGAGERAVGAVQEVAAGAG